MARIHLSTTLFVAALLFCTTNQIRANTIFYTVFLKNSDREIPCDTFSFGGEKGLCREGSGLYTYNLQDIERVQVFNGTKTFVFSNEEIVADEGGLAAALEVLNEQKKIELQARYQEKQERMRQRQIAAAKSRSPEAHTSFTNQQSPSVLPAPIGQFSLEKVKGIGWRQAIAINQDRAITYISKLMYKQQVARPAFIKVDGWQAEKAMHEVMSAIEVAEDMRAAGRHDLIIPPLFRQGPAKP